MRKGEKGIFLLMGVMVVAFIMINSYRQSQDVGEDKGIPFYSTAPTELEKRAMELIRLWDCRDCHSLWSVRNVMQSVPTPALDGLGSLHDEAFFFDYLSAEDPQSIIPSRLKAEYQMPSFKALPEEDRRTLAQYLASLKVEDWYLEEVKKKEYEKLTGKDYPQGESE